MLAVNLPPTSRPVQLSSPVSCLLRAPPSALTFKAASRHLPADEELALTGDGEGEGLYVADVVPSHRLPRVVNVDGPPVSQSGLP